MDDVTPRKGHMKNGFAAGEPYGTGANRSVSYGGVHERLTSDKRAYQQTCSSLKNGQDGSQAYTDTLAYCWRCGRGLRQRAVCLGMSVS